MDPAMIVDVKMEIDDKSIADVVSTILINQDSMVRQLLKVDKNTLLEVYLYFGNFNCFFYN